MAADTGKQSNLLLHLDKVSYGAGAFIAVVVVLLGVILTKDLREKVGDLENKQVEVKRLQGAPVPPFEVAPVDELVKAQWEVSPSTPGAGFTAWSVEARPGDLTVTAAGVSKEAQHGSPAFEKIAVLRDKAKRKAFIEVTVKRGEIEGCKFVRTTLMKAEAGSTEFVELAKIDGEPAVYRDFAVEPGKSYSYKVVTEVGLKDGDTKTILRDEEKVKESVSLASPPIPWDYRIKIVALTEFDATKGTPPSLNGEISYWDYDSMKVEKISRPNFQEGAKFGTKVGGVERYKVKSIFADKLIVQDTSLAGLPTEPLTPKAKDANRPVDLPKEVAPGAAAEPAPAEEKAAKPAAKAKKGADEEDDSSKKKPAAKETKKKDAAKDKKDTKKKRTVK